MEFSPSDEQIHEAPLVKNMKWARHLARVFKNDVSKCEHCGGEMVAICAVMKKESIIRYLKGQGVDYEPPPRAPPRSSQTELEFPDYSYPEDLPEKTLD